MQEFEFSVKMRHKIVNFEKIETFTKEGSLAVRTIQKREYCCGTFSKFLQSYKNITFEELITQLKTYNVISGEDKSGEITGIEVTDGQISGEVTSKTNVDPFELLKDSLMVFFETCEVKEGLKPKKETAEGYLSHIKMHLIKETGGRCNIGDPVKFHDFIVSLFLKIINRQGKINRLNLENYVLFFYFSFYDIIV